MRTRPRTGWQAARTRAEQPCGGRPHPAFATIADTWCDEHPTTRLVDTWRAVATAMTPMRVAEWAARTSTAALTWPAEHVLRRLTHRDPSARRAQLRRATCRWIQRP